MKNTINCLSLSPQLMKKWRISRRCTSEGESSASDGVFTDNNSSLNRQEYFDSLGKLAW